MCIVVKTKFLREAKTKGLPLPRGHDATQDPHRAAAIERGKAAVRKLQQQGILDSQGRRVRTELPADMREGEDRDFGN